MTWFKVDDSFHDHPKVFDAPDCAVALWTRAGTWAARNLTDGFVPSGMPARLCDDPDTAVRELLRRGLWKRASGGYRFHDWADFQPSADSVRTLRAKRAEAGRLGGQAKAAKQNASDGLASASAVAKQNAAPTRPGPKGRGGTGSSLGEQTVTRASPEPPAQCDKHIGDPSPPPCGACADARRTYEAWAKEQADRAAIERSAEAHRQAEITRLAIHACQMCDERGYLNGTLCSHDPNAGQRATRGAAMARAALKERTA